MNGTPRLIGYAIGTDRRLIYTGASFRDWNNLKVKTKDAECFALLDLDAETLSVTIVADNKTVTQGMERKNAVAMYYRDLEAQSQADLDTLRDMTAHENRRVWAARVAAQKVR